MASLRVVEPGDVRRQSSAPVIIGVDVGQRVDPSTIVVAEAFPLDNPDRAAFRYEVRHLERLPIGTPYPAVGDRIAAVVNAIEARPRPINTAPPWLELRVDTTGVGRPVTDALADALRGSRCRLRAVTFVHGDKLDTASGEWRLGKAYLVSTLQVLFQQQRIALPAGHPDAGAMLRELLDYEIKVSEDASDRYGAFRVGSHDDLVTALGLAVIAEPRVYTRYR